MSVSQLRCFVFTLVLFASAGASLAHGSGPGLVLAERPDSADPRLSAVVSYECWHKPVAAVLQDLGRQAKVQLDAGSSTSDWQVRERKIDIVVNDVTLAQLMDSIARVLKLRWSINGSARPASYRLVADQTEAKALQSQILAKRKELADECANRRTKLVETIAKIADYSGENLEKLKDKNAYLYDASESGFARLATRVFAEIPSVKEAFLRGEKNLAPPVKSLSPDTQKLLMQVAVKQWPKKEDRELPKDYEAQLSRSTIMFDTAAVPGDVAWLNFFGNVKTSLSDDTLIYLGSFRNPDLRYNKLSAQIEQIALEKGGPDMVPDELTSKLDAAVLERYKDQDAYSALEPIAEHPDEPALHKKIEVTSTYEQFLSERAAATGLGMSEMTQMQASLKTMAAISGFGIVSDSYGWLRLRGAAELSPAELVLADVLNTYSGTTLSNWEMHGPIIEFHRRDWFAKRSNIVPDEWVNRWRSSLKTTGTMPLDQYAEMGILNWDQLYENLFWDPMLKQAAGPSQILNDNQGVLRFYLALSPAQRKALFAGGIDGGQLSAVQKKVYSEMFDYGHRIAWDTDWFSKPGDRRVSIKGSLESKYGIKLWSIAVTAAQSGGESRQVVFEIPRPRVNSEGRPLPQPLP